MSMLLRIKRLTPLLPYILSGVYAFLVPTQLAKHFWPSWSYVQGVRLDYLAPTVALLDVFGCIVLTVYWRNVVHILYKKNRSTLYILGLLIALNAVFSLAPILSILSWGKLLLPVLVVCVLVDRLGGRLDAFVVGLTCGTFVQCALVIAQFMSQSSVQGIWYWLGERSIVLSLPDIAKVFVAGREYLRPYGTFSHPNTMAGYFVLLYFFLHWALPFITHKRIRMIVFGGMMIAPFLVLASFSKVAIVSFVVGTLIMVWSSTDYGECLVCRIARTLVLGVVLLVFSIPAGDPLSAEKRLVLFGNAIQVFLAHPWWGTGWGAYTIAQSQIPLVPKYAPLHQPVHNIGMLALAELGIGGLLALGIAMRTYMVRIKMNPLLVAMGMVFLITGFFDHYWLTQSQTRVLATLVTILVLQNHRLIPMPERTQT